MNRLGRFLVSVLRFFVVAVPVWFLENIIFESVRQMWRWFTGQVRRHALWIILVGIVLLLVVTKQYHLLDLLLRFSLTIGLMGFGFRVMFRGCSKKKKKK